MTPKTESSEAVKIQLEMNINADIFAPKVASHIPRAWERRAVSAHAPRLTGKRVWKRPEHKSKPDETNYEEGIVELEKEGAGARKRVRQTGARDAIRDATWDNKSSKENDARDIVDPAQLSPVKSQPLGIIKGLGMIEPEHTVPRKRTYVNHILTPKRRSRQVTLEHFTHVEMGTASKGGNTPRRQSIRKSIRRSIMPTEDFSPARLQSPQLGLFETKPASSPSPRKRSTTQSTPTRARSPQKPTVQDFSEVAEHSLVEAVKEGGSRKSLRRSTRSIRTSSVMEIAESSDLTVESILSEPSVIPLEQLQPDALENATEIADTVMENTDDGLIESEVPADNGHGSVPELSESVLEPVSVEEVDVETEPEVEQPAEAVKAVDTDEPTAIVKPVEALEFVEDAHINVESPKTTTDLTSPSSASSDSSLSEISTPELDRITDLPSEQLLVEQAAQPSSDDIDLGFISPIKTSEALKLISSPIVGPTEGEHVEQMQESTLSQSHKYTSSTETTTDYHQDDTDMLLNFLTRVKADKAAKAQQSPPRPRRKRSLPHSPLRLPLGDVDTNLSPSPKKSSAPDFDAIIEPPPSPSRTPSAKGSKSKRENPLSTPLPDEDTATINTPIRRSGRTRLPVKKDPVTGPSLIPVRRLGQDAETTVTLKRSVDKELAALTRVNTRKNKGGALCAIEVLAKQAEAKDDPVLRQKLLKDAFNDKEKRKAGKKSKTVVWAEELVHFQTEEKKIEEVKEKKEVKVGVRSKIALAMGNGTPAPKRKRGKA